MLLSMTGFGESHRRQDGLAVTVETRTVNSRFFKLSVRVGEGYAALESQIEKIVRGRIRRGTIQVTVRVERGALPDDFRINADVLGHYRRQLESLQRQWKMPGELSIESLLLLPGVIDANADRQMDCAADWPLICETVEEALENLDQMRTEEGRAMTVDLRANRETALAELKQVEQRAPLVADTYRQRLEERLGTLLAAREVVLEPADLIREVGFFAERSDISEEIVRLYSHLEQFDAIMEQPEASGKKLDFITQEMFREINTIGSKANDVEIAKHVIEIKAAVERIREMIQNIE